MVTTSSPAHTATRRTLTPQVAYVLVAGVIGLALFASATPSPLYGIYRDLWGFSPAVLTLVYATYAFGVLTALLLAGRVSDEVGRRPVLLVSLGALLATSVLFMLADSVAWLFVARGLQGLATGLALGAASAALLDLHPRRDPAGVGLTNGVASAGGIGLGVLVSATLVQLLPAPRVLPYVVLFVLFAVAFAGALLMPEPVTARSRLRLTPQRPSVPSTVRRPFLLASLAVLSSWSVGGLFLSLGPQLSASLFDTTNHVVTGISVFVLAACGSAAQLGFGRRPPWVAAAGGSVALAAGTATIVLAAATESAALLLIGSVIGGAGFGLAFLGALRALSAAIPPDHRAAVMSAFYVVAYLSLSVPAVLAGVGVTPLGLESTFEILGSVAATLALVVAVEAWRTRPRPAEPGRAPSGATQVGRLRARGTLRNGLAFDRRLASDARQEQGGDEGERGEADRPPEGMGEGVGQPRGAGGPAALVLEDHGERCGAERRADLLEAPDRARRSRILLDS
jgi:MFS family permease